MTDRGRLAVCLATLALVSPVRNSLADTVLRGIAVDQRIDAPPVAALPAGAPAFIRVLIERPPASATETESTLARLRTLLELYGSRHDRVLLSLGEVPSAGDTEDDWRQFIKRVVEESRETAVAYQVGGVSSGAVPDATRYAYLLKLAAIQIRSVDPVAVVLQGGIPLGESAWQGRVFTAGLGPYVDGFALDGAASDDDEAFRPALLRMAALLEREKPASTVVLGTLVLASDPAVASARAMDSILRSTGTAVRVTALAGEPAAVTAALVAAARVTDLIGTDLVTLDERASRLRILQGTTDVTATVPHRLLYSLATLDTYLVYRNPRASPLDLEVTVANAATPTVRDPLSSAAPAPSTQAAPKGGRLRFALPAGRHTLIVDFDTGTSYAASVDVRKDALLRIEEIIFRHQQAQLAQDALLKTYIAHVRIEQHFHPSAADPQYNLVTENRLFSDHGVVEWEELSFELNGAKWTENRPSFPLVQPEKVLSLPLDLRLNQDYTYRLDGTEEVGGRPAYVVRFDPLDASRALYRGTVWIDRLTFVKLKIQAVETKLSGPVVSNDETQVFEPSGDVGGRPIWLMRRLSSEQVFLIAGRSVLIERDVRLSDVILNPPTFEQERDSARLSNRIMYRDTASGVRYLVKQGQERVVSDRMTTSAKAVVLGANFDPSFNRPLPIGGIDILDFNFLNRNLQLALLYGGVIVLGNVQHANLWGGRFDASVDFFGLALKEDDDVFDSIGKKSGDSLEQIPVSVGFNVGYQLTPFQKLTGRYELNYDAYFRTATTSPGFVTPSNTAINGEGAGYEYRRRGYSLLANATAYQRSTWTAWGDVATFDPGDKTFTKYDIGISKDFTFSTFHTIHFNGTYFGGQRLDRFSMYEFGQFDATRMHGVPTSVRFAELAMFRGSYSFNLFEQYRLDLFLDHASGRDPEIDNDWRQVTGTGVRLNLRAPLNTILQIDYGKSFLPDIYHGVGTNVVQILLLKPL